MGVIGNGNLGYFWGKVKDLIFDGADANEILSTNNGTSRAWKAPTDAICDYLDGINENSGVLFYNENVEVYPETSSGIADFVRPYITRPWYGTCSTTASTAEKVVTCSNFRLYAGSIIGIYFSTANTASTPTLNVNSTSAKSIYVGNSTPNGTTNVLKWSAGAVLYFMYDGTRYRYICSVNSGSNFQSDGAGTWYALSSTSASTAAKTCTCTNFRLTPGALIAVNFTYANTYTSGAITLNVNSTGAYSIYINGEVTSSTNKLTWNAGATLLFMYMGSQWTFLSMDPHSHKEIRASYSNSMVDATAYVNTTSNSSGSEISIYAYHMDTEYGIVNDNRLVIGSDGATLNDQQLATLDLVYPIGSIYMSVNNTNPSTLFGGTWVQLEDTFLLGAGSTYSVNHVNDETNGEPTPTIDGGEATHYHTTGSHKLTAAESGVPAHAHLTANSMIVYNNASANSARMATSGSGTKISLNSTYASQQSTHNLATYANDAASASSAHSHGDTGNSSNMPPYMVVYIWKRTA